MKSSRMKHAMPRQHPVRRWVLTGLAVLLVALLAVSGWIWVSAQRALDSATQGRGGSAMDILVPKPLIGEETGVVNILLAGNSFDDDSWEHDGAELTDSIMVASMELATKQISLVSIPRDLWVEYQGEHMKINAVYLKGGLVGLGEVVERVTGLPTTQHLLVGYTALRDAVDAVGGIDVDIQATDPRGIYDPKAGDLRLPNGMQHIDGATALQLCRARNHGAPGKTPYGVSDGDFGRARNQRMVLAALLTKVKTSPALANPVAVVQIFDSVSANVRTDLSVGQIRRIYDLSTASTTPIKSCSIRGDDTHYLLVDYMAGSAATVVPAAGTYNYTDIRKFLRTYCRTSPEASPTPVASTATASRSASPTKSASSKP